MIRPLSVASPDPSRESLPHVLLVVDQLPKTLGGGERIVLKLAGLLPAYGYRASILTFAADPQSPAFKSPPCPIYLLPLRRTYDLQALRAAFELKRFLHQQQIQIVQTFFESSDLWAGLVAKKLAKTALIWSRRDMGILRAGKHHLAYRLMAGVPDAVFAVSEQVRQHCIDVDHIDPSRVQTIYNGLDLAIWNAIAPPTRTSSEVHIATVGNVRRVKGHDVLIKAAAEIVRHFPGTTFSIAGAVMEPEYFAELETLVRDLNLLGRFHFVGNITDLHEYLAAADIFVLPSRSEGFSNAIIEAMAASLPVVATNVGGNAEAVQHGTSGFIVPPDDADKLANAVIQLLNDTPRAKSMGAAGRKIVEENFTTAAMMSKTTAIYKNLLAEQTLR
ncbi:glycosyl transferase [Edaphobacter acidisoli]|uniref:Glycosyl transferase n=1 Tax=Edaphobacter acidisoli TaxID=2040573 RepID=A0A916W7Y7_9BACT|nr:glycosyltransferase family 4 protein [Edaphobacter acidisoli]GGA76520.1 glycosyl transferase [Edaphobacter acidisoli]